MLKILAENELPFYIVIEFDMALNFGYVRYFATNLAFWTLFWIKMFYNRVINVQITSKYCDWGWDRKFLNCAVNNA